MNHTSSPQNNPTHELAQLLGDFIGTIMRRSACETMKIIRREELSMTQLVTLWFLRRSGTATISDIREHLNLSLAATSHLVDRLVVGGFVSRNEGVVDRRHKEVMLTDAGFTLLAEIEQARVAELAQHLGSMPQTQLQTTVDALAEVLHVLQSSEAQLEHAPRKLT
jgi:DNA-binding MarR family transcriptional regulator